MELWPHQVKSLEDIKQAIADGEQSILVTSPTGGGKTRQMLELIDWAHWDQDWMSIIYSNRKMLVDQTSKVLKEGGIRHGMRSASHQANLMESVQVSSVQTERSRVYKKGQWHLHPAQLVLIDEAHVNGNGTAEKLIREHREKGAYTIGFTATPLDLAHLYDHLIIAGTPSELRHCGALVPALHYGPDEPDLKKIEKIKVGNNGEFSEQQVRKVFQVQKVFGRIVEWYRKLNPEQVPAILFAPGVAESVWCAEQFTKQGIPAASIDGANIWIDGQAYDSDSEAREELRLRSQSGEIKVVCNRFVMREGIDWPWLKHAILATVFGGLQSYIQSCGRPLRACPGYQNAVLQDHGGNWHRHGSINADREWDLLDTNRTVTGVRLDKLREKKTQEPIVCPKCSAVRQAGKQCPMCQFEYPLKQRVVIQSNGEPKVMDGDVYRSRRRRRYEGIDHDWRGMYHRGLNRCKKGENCSFIQLEALFAKEHNWSFPPRDLPLMPKNHVDWFRTVDSVPREELIQ